MKMTTRLYITTMTILIISLTGCNNDIKNQTIPTVNENNIADAVKTLDVSTNDFEAFLTNIDVSYDDFIKSLNESNTSLEDLKDEIEKNYDCTYSEYIKTVTLVNNKDIPDDAQYDVFKSKYSVLDTYIPTKELDITKTKLINYDIEINIADEDTDSYAFDSMAMLNGDFSTYISALNQEYGCKSAEFTNIALFGGHGVTKPETANACMDNIFVYDEKTNEILEKITVSTLTMHFEDENNDITLGLSNDLGLLFKTTGADSYEKMAKLSNMDFQVRRADNNN